MAYLLCTVLADMVGLEEEMILGHPIIVSLREKIWHPNMFWTDISKNPRTGFNPSNARVTVRWLSKRRKDKISITVTIPYGRCNVANPNFALKYGSRGPILHPAQPPPGSSLLEVDETLHDWAQKEDHFHNQANARRNTSDETRGSRPLGGDQGQGPNQFNVDNALDNPHRSTTSRLLPSESQSVSLVEAHGSPNSSPIGRQQQATRWSRSALETIRSAGSRLSPSRTESPRRFLAMSPRNNAVSNTPPPTYTEAVREMPTYFSPLRNLISSLSISSQPSTPPRREAVNLDRNATGSFSDSPGSENRPYHTGSASLNQHEHVPSGGARLSLSREAEVTPNHPVIPVASHGNESATQSNIWTRRSQRLSKSKLKRQVRGMGPVEIVGRLAIHDTSSENP